MARDTEDRRRALRQTLIDIAERRIAADGLSALRARDLAAEAGCALGAIYTVFADLTDLVLEVNARTFQRLGAAVAASQDGTETDPTARLIAMGQAYHRFAADNRTLWRALFDIDRPAGQAAPDWYLREMGLLFRWIDAPLAELDPALPEADRALMVRALFSAVHGIVTLALDEASAGVPGHAVDRMIALLLWRISTGS